MNFADQRKAASARLSKSPAPKGKDYAYPVGKPNTMSGSQGTDVTMLDSVGNKQPILGSKPAYVNRSGHGGTSKNY